MLLLFSEVIFLRDKFCRGSHYHIKGNQVCAVHRSMHMAWGVLRGEEELCKGEKCHGNETVWAGEIDCHAIVDGNQG